MLPIQIAGIALAGGCLIVAACWAGVWLRRDREKAAESRAEREQRRAANRAEIDRLWALVDTDKERQINELKIQTYELNKTNERLMRLLEVSGKRPTQTAEKGGN